MENSEWSLSNVGDCQAESYKLLETRLMGNINATTLIEYVSELSNLTNTLLPIFPQDIITASNILDTIIKYANIFSYCVTLHLHAYPVSS